MPKPSDDILNVICKVAAEGEAKRGSDGVVLFDRAKQTIAWSKLAEVSSEDLREAASELLSEEGHLFVFVLEEDSEIHQVHIWKISRAELSTRIQGFS